MLNSPARYFPIEKGLYEVAPGLRNLGLSFGNGRIDGLVFQLDSEFSKYRNNKLACRSERLSKYYTTHQYPEGVCQAVNQFLITKLTEEYPKFFKIYHHASGEAQFTCKLTEETFSLSSNLELLAVSTSNTPTPPYQSTFDALCSQVQEDIAILCKNPAGEDWLAAIHLCSPGHWAAEDKISKNFFEIHKPVPGIEKISRAAASFVDAMIQKGPYVRFVWGFATDTQLNHHPEPPPGHDPLLWRGRAFNRSQKNTPFYLRVERQVLWGLPQVNAAVFTIRIYFIDGHEIRSNPQERTLLRSGLLSMTPESRVYKGVDSCMDELITWLDTV